MKFIANIIICLYIAFAATLLCANIVLAEENTTVTSEPEIIQVEPETPNAPENVES